MLYTGPVVFTAPSIYHPSRGGGGGYDLGLKVAYIISELDLLKVGVCFFLTAGFGIIARGTVSMYNHQLPVYLASRNMNSQVAWIFPGPP